MISLLQYFNSSIVCSYFMLVCGIVKTTARGAVDSLMHQTVHNIEGSSFDYSIKTVIKYLFYYPTNAELKNKSLRNRMTNALKLYSEFSCCAE